MFINFVKQQQELIQESDDSFSEIPTITTNRMSYREDVQHTTELQPILTDTDDVLLDLHEDDIDTSLRSSQVSC